jgi:hypothetical protein
MPAGLAIVSASRSATASKVNCDTLKIALAKNLQAPGINGRDA